MSKRLDPENLRSLTVYQAVKFDGRLSKFFVTRDTAHHREVKLEIEPGVGVLVSNERDSLVIPFPNIAGIELKTEYKSNVEESRKADLAKPAKAQKVSKPKVDPKLPEKKIQ